MKLKVSLIQMNIKRGDKNANIKFARRAVAASKGDIAILPEMFSTGFITDDISLAEPMNGYTVDAIKEMARSNGKTVAGSVIIKEPDGRCYNRFIFALPDGTTRHYDKRHLFSFGGEDELFERGRERVVIEYKGVRILLLICYDLRFPVWSRSTKDYDAIIYVASWPESRIKVWDTLLQARAIENQCYVLGVNRVGNDPAGYYPGHSMVVDYYGNIIANTDEGAESIIETALDTEGLKEFRGKFRAWQDADEFNINL